MEGAKILHTYVFNARKLMNLQIFINVAVFYSFWSLWLMKMNDLIIQNLCNGWMRCVISRIIQYGRARQIV